MARHATESTSSTTEPEQRRTASDKLAYHRNLREALRKISHSPEDFIMVATQPLQSFPVLGALDATVQLIPRDDSYRAVSRRRCRGAATEQPRDRSSLSARDRRRHHRHVKWLVVRRHANLERPVGHAVRLYRSQPQVRHVCRDSRAHHCCCHRHAAPCGGCAARPHLQCLAAEHRSRRRRAARPWSDAKGSHGHEHMDG